MTWSKAFKLWKPDFKQNSSLSRSSVRHVAQNKAEVTCWLKAINSFPFRVAKGKYLNGTFILIISWMRFKFLVYPSLWGVHQHWENFIMTFDSVHYIWFGWKINTSFLLLSKPVNKLNKITRIVTGAGQTSWQYTRSSQELNQGHNPDQTRLVARAGYNSGTPEKFGWN